MIICQTGDVHSGEVYDPEAVVFHQWGLLSMPAAPVPGESAPEGIVFKTGSGDVVVGGRSVRSGEIAGLIKPGESCFFADGSRASILCKNDGSVRLVTTHDNSRGGRTIAATVGTNGVDLSTPWSRLTISDLGIHGYCVRSDGSAGAYFDLGSVAGLPAPFDAMGTYLAMGANLVRIEGQTIALGTDAGVAEPVAKATTTVTVLDAVSNALAAASSAFTRLNTPSALVAPSGGGPVVLSPTLIAAISNAASAISAATAAIAAAHTTLPSTSTTVT